MSEDKPELGGQNNNNNKTYSESVEDRSVGWPQCHRWKQMQLTNTCESETSECVKIVVCCVAFETDPWWRRAVCQWSREGRCCKGEDHYSPLHPGPEQHQCSPDTWTNRVKQHIHMSVYIKPIFILLIQHLRLRVDVNNRTNLLINVVPYFDLSDIYFTGYFYITVSHLFVRESSFSWYTEKDD